MLKHILGRFFAISTPSEPCPIAIDVPGRLGNGGGARVALEYGGETGRRARFRAF